MTKPTTQGEVDPTITSAVQRMKAEYDADVQRARERRARVIRMARKAGMSDYAIATTSGYSREGLSHMANE